jgi:cbb3-type cytochrome oxidase subunit 3
MSVEIVRASIMVTLFVAFIVLWVWAWGRQRSPDFEAAAQLPLEDDCCATYRSERT